jgi:DNA-directed RNA polymerase subunit alpha
VLLASLQGAAITAVRIDGALHEFTTISDVVEDVTDIILNLKEVVFKAEAPRTYTVRLEKEGPGEVTAGDIQVVDGLSVLNPGVRRAPPRAWRARDRARARGPRAT